MLRKPHGKTEELNSISGFDTMGAMILVEPLNFPIAQGSWNK
jgi:hypothetical protein